MMISDHNERPTAYLNAETLIEVDHRHEPSPQT